MYVEDEIAAAANPQPRAVEDLYTLEPVPESISQEQDQALRLEAQKVKQLIKDLDQNFYDYKEFYVVSAKWFKRWEVYVSYNESNNDLPSSKFIGSGRLPILNEDIVDMDFKTDVVFEEPYHYLNLALIDGLKADVDYLLVNKSIWEILEQYQNIQVVRKMRETEDGRKVQVHLRKISAIPLCNQLLKDVERQIVKTFKKFHVQLPQHQQIDNLLPIISEKGKEFLNSSAGWSRKVDFSQDSFKVWVVEDEMTETKLRDNLRKGCKANASFSYKLNFPGQLVVFDGAPLSKLELNPRTLVVFEFKERREDWVLFNKQTFLYAKCDSCRNTHILNVFCPCMYRCYCSKDCKGRDKSNHKNRCDRDAESSEDEKEEQITELSKKGRMGLRNLGNTCFMNSGIQCISSIEQLIQYFFHGTFVADINTHNPIGTKGQLSTAYAKLIKKMLCGTDASVSPSVLKRAIGKFQPMFIGYDQHDSGELISYLLDGLHQDLNRIKIKPYVETKHHGGRPDPVLAKEGWQNFTMRNQSKIVQLLFGQYKSKLCCPVCHQQSITFDPFMMLPLPIPQSNKKPMQVLVMKDHVHSIKLTVIIDKSPSYTMQTLMNDVAQKLNISNKMVASGGSHYSSEYIESDKPANDIRKQFKHKNIILRPLQPQQNTETGEKVNVESSLCNSYYGAAQSNRRNITIQKIYLFDKSKTLKDIHLTLFSYYKSLLTDVNDYEQDIINVPAADQKWRILIVSNGKHEVCFFCGQMSCENCPLPFDDKVTLGDLLGKVKPGRYLYKLGFEIYWRKNTDAVEKAFEKFEKIDTGYNTLNEDTISIYDCFKLAQEPETLDQDNEWYCPVCKDFVLAQKQLTLYKAPKIFIMYFKRFKGRGLRGLTQSKLSTLIDFPVENLDINDFIMDKSLPTEYDKKEGNMQIQQKVKYDLFAISNHYGSLGGGHYTAYCKKGGEWDQYDDSSVSSVSASKIVTPAAYVLFYRRRNQ